jgi:hypothetical protein
LIDLKLHHLEAKLYSKTAYVFRHFVAYVIMFVQ